jgi:hypothetical protein
MNRIMKRAFAVLPIIALLCLAACAKPPQAEMDAATAAVAKAQGNPDVVAYAPDTLKRAQDTLARMKSESQSRKYDKAKASAVEAKTLAENSLSEATANKDRVKSEAQALIEAVKKAFPELDKLVVQAKKVRGVKLDFQAVAKEIEGVKATASDAQAAFDEGNFLAAKTKASDAQTALADIQKRIGDAVQALSRKK